LAQAINTCVQLAIFRFTQLPVHSRMAKTHVACLITAGAVFLALAIWATVDRSKYTPIYRPIQCTSPTAEIPVDLPKVMQVGLNATVHVAMTCENSNPYSVTLKSNAHGSRGTMLVPNLTDFTSPPIVAGQVFFQEMTLAPGGSAAGEISQTAELTPEFIKDSLTYILAHNKTFPAYMEMDVKTDAEAKFMFISKEKQNVLPVKYCGYYLGLNEAMTKLSITSPMVCRDTYADMQRAVQQLDYQSGPVGFVDNLDPTEETLNSLAHEINLGAGTVELVGYFVCAACWIAAGRWFLRVYQQKRKSGDVTNKDSNTATGAADVQVNV